MLQLESKPPVYYGAPNQAGATRRHDPATAEKVDLTGGFFVLFLSQ
jgi:hypothetical protein